MIKIAIAGSHGKMGKRIIALAEKDKAITVVSEFDVGTDAEREIAKCDILIDFTAPQATVEHVKTAEHLKKGIVIGTTGLSKEENEAIQRTSKNIPIVISPNMSVGVNLLFKLCQDTARTLSKDYKVSMREVHHIYKKDSPSGTAKRLADLVALEHKIPAAEIPIESIREGEVVGDHKVMFESDEEVIELFHSAKSRDTFAAGALKAAKFLAGKKSGLFSMRDVLGI
ncbi:MAG: 4-hydroxy-tetrahydrodipicolinate reductase [Candidatus Omnitrophica bacterium]|nr:4-hydroxy-tetrahydrodipicolinate reductase [Candidatus Omnitrophota bacterium]MBU4488918.1 4-hydroxy-tetrahydrodipicolinate reductase [Candidatus Omnitrophota bacterium]MCG2705314.1 4-hydroxy-tetrahydrodipicolinate reductase [Candidatus Omnitrophota bacterium]